ncbi:MAG TPA: cytidylate kinase-like family protein [Terracidiphilus sp.]|nr:cytidylate kinase-like family protein [Terracidiphilus sp.]
MIRAITIEREFGCGASEIASLVANRLGWNLWDQRLTEEIARLTDSTPEAVERREWRRDSAVYRVFRDFLRGAFEGGLPPANRLRLLDAHRIAEVSETAVKTAFSSGPSVIVGRGAQYYLRNREDVFHVFLYASRDHKIRKLISMGAKEKKAIQQVDTTDLARGQFVRKYFGLKWPEPCLYQVMLNTEMGESRVAAMLIRCVEQFESAK